MKLSHILMGPIIELKHFISVCLYNFINIIKHEGKYNQVFKMSTLLGKRKDSDNLYTCALKDN